MFRIGFNILKYSDVSLFLKGVLWSYEEEIQTHNFDIYNVNEVIYKLRTIIFSMTE